MKLSDNMTIVVTVLFNVLKDLGVIGIFGFLSYHFNNIWIMLFALLFIGGYHIKMNSKEVNDDEK